MPLLFIPPPAFNLYIGGGTCGGLIGMSLGGGFVISLFPPTVNIPGALPKFLGLIVLVKGVAPLSVEYGVYALLIGLPVYGFIGPLDDEAGDVRIFVEEEGFVGSGVGGGNR